MTTKEMIDGYKKYRNLSQAAKTTARQLAQPYPELKALLEIFDTLERKQLKH